MSQLRSAIGFLRHSFCALAQSAAITRASSRVCAGYASPFSPVAGLKVCRVVTAVFAARVADSPWLTDMRVSCSRPLRILSGLPLDAATHARSLLLRRRSATQQRLARRPQLLPRHWNTVAGGTAIEPPAIGESPVTIEQKEIRRTDRLVRLCDLLRLVIEIRKGESLGRGNPGHLW